MYSILYLDSWYLALLPPVSECLVWPAKLYILSQCCCFLLVSAIFFLFLCILKRPKSNANRFVFVVLPATTRLKAVFLSLSYKCVVKINSIIPVICTMKRQRRNDILVEQVVERLKTVRRERGLTQENVRFDTDLNIGRIESGRHSISLTTLADLCDYYNVPLEDFFKKIVTR